MTQTFEAAQRARRTFFEVTKTRAGVRTAGAIIALGGIFPACGNGDQSVAAQHTVPIETSTTINTPTTTSTTEQEPTHSRLRTEYDPVYPYSTEPEVLLEQLRTNIYRAGFVESEELRQRYVEFLVGSNDHMYQAVYDYVSNIKTGLDASGLEPDDYFEQEANIYQFVGANEVGDESLSIDYMVIDTAGEHPNMAGRFLLRYELASGEYPERFTIAG